MMVENADQKEGNGNIHMVFYALGRDNGLHPKIFHQKGRGRVERSWRDTVDDMRHTFMLYGYSSRADETPPEFLTSNKHFLSVRS